MTGGGMSATTRSRELSPSSACGCPVSESPLHLNQSPNENRLEFQKQMNTKHEKLGGDNKAVNLTSSGALVPSHTSRERTESSLISVI
jgi:hypothetical protein